MAPRFLQPLLLNVTLVQSNSAEPSLYSLYSCSKLRVLFFSCVSSRDSRDSCSISVLPYPQDDLAARMAGFDLFVGFSRLLQGEDLTDLGTDQALFGQTANSG